MPRVFSVFQSINSKGKPLDEIDKIKTYIFSILDECDYDTYLTKWGQLIIESDDKLGDYFQVFIRAYISYYRQKINLKEFKAITTKQLPSCYGVSDQAEALKIFIDDMLDKVECYSLICNAKKLCKKVKKPEFETFYTLYTCIGYEHPKALFFRALCECKSLKMSKKAKNSLTLIVKAATLFMFKFQSIRGGDSKDAIRYFEQIADYHYGKAIIDPKYVVKVFSDALIKEGVTKEVIVSSFIAIDFYSKHDLAYCILSLLESIDESNDNHLLYGQATTMLQHIKDQAFQIDHMLPQRPKKNEKKLKYYCDVSSGEELLVLKQGHDFPEDTVVNGMRYDEFLSLTLHRLGNIRLYLAQENRKKSNGVTHLPNHEDFTSYKQVIKRCKKMADLLMNSPDLA